MKIGVESINRDIAAIRLRSVLDPKRFYKKDKSIFGGPIAASFANKSQSKASSQKDIASPKLQIQVGTIVCSPWDSRRDNLTRKEKRQTIIESLLADQEARMWQKSKYQQIVEKKRNAVKGGYLDVKRQRDRKRFGTSTKKK